MKLNLEDLLQGKFLSMLNHAIKLLLHQGAQMLLQELDLLNHQQVHKPLE
jgi:hypothetical protein